MPPFHRAVGRLTLAELPLRVYEIKCVGRFSIVLIRLATVGLSELYYDYDWLENTGKHLFHRVPN